MLGVILICISVNVKTYNIAVDSETNVEVKTQRILIYLLKQVLLVVHSCSHFYYTVFIFNKFISFIVHRLRVSQLFIWGDFICISCL